MTDQAMTRHGKISGIATPVCLLGGLMAVAGESPWLVLPVCGLGALLCVAAGYCLYKDGG